MKRRFIVGAGKVANVIRRPEDVVLSHSDIEVTSDDSVLQAFKRVGVKKGDVVINTASKINLEWCEENKIEAFDTNCAGALRIAAICDHIGAKLVHISSGCIFDGNHVLFGEEDIPTPAAWYSRTKVWADEIVRSLASDHLILRPRQLISAVPNPTNMLTKFLSLKKLNCINEPNSVTCIEDFGAMIDHLVEGGYTGTFNCANEGMISPYEIALELKRRIDPTMEVSHISYDNYLKTLKVKRVNTILDLTKLRSTGYVIPNVYDALDRCISNYGASK